MLVRFAPGQAVRAIPASTWNAFADATDRVLGQDGPPGQAFGALAPEALVVRVANLHTATRSQFSAVGLGDPIILPSASQPRFLEAAILKAYRANLTTYRFKTGILLRELRQNEADGVAAIYGAVPCRINVAHAAHPFVAPPPAGSSYPDYLETNWWGCGRILWKESGTGQKWAVVQLGDYWSHTVVGKPDANIAKGATGTVSIWELDGTTDTGSDVVGASALGAAVTANKWVTLVWPATAKEPIVGPWEC